MVELGFTLSCEEQDARSLVRLARRAEEAGFAFATISDHFHPWTSKQGHAPFAWSVLGGVAATTSTLRVGTAVTCPLVRYHPAVVAQAAATVGEMMPGRFFLGLGSGEALNEHVVGTRWPPASVRQEMLAEAIVVIRALFTGETLDHHGAYYTVEGARLFVDGGDIPILVAASGDDAAELAGRLGDGLVATKPDPGLVDAYRGNGGSGPRLGQLTVCYDEDEARARRTALEWWPNAAIPGQLGQELPMPSHFEQAAGTVREDDVAGAVVCGPDARRHVDAVLEFERAGFDQVVVHQVGPDPDGALDFYAREVLPQLARGVATAARGAGDGSGR